MLNNRVSKGLSILNVSAGSVKLEVARIQSISPDVL